MLLKAALQQGSKLLEQGAIASPRLTAELLLCHALGRDRPYLYSHSLDELSETTWLHYGRYLYQRLNGKPLQYITRRQEFYGRTFRVSPDVLIPRPETEFLIEVALSIAPRPHRAVDIGTGSGALAITWQLETGFETFAVDISSDALAVARANNGRLGARVQFLRSDLTSALAPASLGLILCNPPYIPEGDRETLQREVRDHEPHVALFAGPTGLEIYRPLIADAARVLEPGGHIVLEIGYQAEAGVRGLLTPPWTDVRLKHDLAGWPRVLSARYAP